MSSSSNSAQAEHRAELLRILDELIALLEAVGEHHWLAWAQRCRARIDAWDSIGIDGLLRAYGGMGSFNDLVLDPINGHNISREDADVVNRRFDRLRSDVYAVASRLQALL